MSAFLAATARGYEWAAAHPEVRAPPQLACLSKHSFLGRTLSRRQLAAAAPAHPSSHPLLLAFSYFSLQEAADLLVDAAAKEQPDLPESLEQGMVRESMGVVAKVSLLRLCQFFIFNVFLVEKFFMWAPS